MAEVVGRWDPKALYSLCVDIMADYLKIFKREIRCLTASILFDIYFKLYKKNSLSLLADEFSRLENFIRLLKLSKCRVRLHECFQTSIDQQSHVSEHDHNKKSEKDKNTNSRRITVSLNRSTFSSVLRRPNHFVSSKQSRSDFCTKEKAIIRRHPSKCPTLEEHGAGVAQALTTSYVSNANKCLLSPCMRSRLSIIDTGLRLGSFLFDAGWFEKAEKVLSSCKEVCESVEPTAENQILLLQCCHKLLRVQAVYCNFVGAQETYHQTLALIEDLKRTDNAPHLAGIYAEFSYYFFAKNEYEDSHRYSKAALEKLRTERTTRSSCMARNGGVPLKTVVEVLRHASLSCAVKRNFTRAGLLVRQAVDLAAEVFGTSHPKYADALLDYGFFLLCYDSIQQCVQVYEKAYQIKTSVFKRDNIHVAIALEDLAYGLYVREYNSGRFQLAKEKSEECIRIMEKFLPDDHFLLSSAKRVKALILEEIAIENTNERSCLLQDAEKLHLEALNISIKALGYKNVQTAKHYGNLGRLYQSMKKYTLAEEMHLKAIAIKEELLGEDHYEVGLSVGHLASLYNYHLKEFGKAIDLYLRSISINVKLFGKLYSGLEYDYRGLIHLFMNLDDPEKVAEYSFQFNTWKVLRKHQLEKNEFVLMHQPSRPLDEILEALPDCSEPSVSMS